MASRSRQLPLHRRLPGLLLLLPALFFLTTGFASSRFTEKQLEAFEKYIGKTYWAVAEEGKRALFFSAPSPSAASFLAELKESLQVTEMVQGAGQRPAYYYKVRFGSGRDGYIDVDSFLGELNLTLLTVDPDRGQKMRSAKEAEGKSKRAARIRAQPWPEHIKEAVLQRKAVLGMTVKEAREALGKPARVVKVRDASPLMGQQEQWIYQSGPVLTFTNGLITRIQAVEAKNE